jgi:C1A family cysteine protease
MVECGWDYFTLGCNGGNYITAWNYAIDHPITLEAKYHYTAKDDKDCDKAKEAAGTYGVKDITLVQEKSTQALKDALNRAPVSVAIMAEEGNFRFYESGVIREDCGNTVDHAVLAVGYGADYFIIKNSWGADWGDHGFAKIGTGNDENRGICGILTLPAYATI